MNFIETIGKRLKLIRTYSGLQQKEVALKLDIKASTLSLYEQGKREPSISFLADFCNFFSISLSHFFIIFDLQEEPKNTLSSLSKELDKILIGLEKKSLKAKPNMHKY